MDEERIDNVICEIMHRDGPDRHITGHDKITEFIMALLHGDAEDWIAGYSKDTPSRYVEEI